MICRFQLLVFQGENLCCFQTVFFFFWGGVFTRGLHGDYQEFFNRPVGLFLEFLPTKLLQNGEEANATLKKKVMKFPYPKTKQEV